MRLAAVVADGPMRTGLGPPNAEENADVAAIATNSRADDRGHALIIDLSALSGRNVAVYLRSPEGRANLSDCDPDVCLQPCLGA